MSKLFDLDGAIAVITGGAGLLGQQHAAAIAQANGRVVLLDIRETAAKEAAEVISEKYGVTCLGLQADVTDRVSIENAGNQIGEQLGSVSILINNAANNPKMDSENGVEFSRFENFSLQQWQDDYSIGLTGAFLCCQVFGSLMAERKKGVIVNIASDLGVIAPDQRIYRKEGLPDDQQPVKPVSYSVVKHGLIGLTRYLATYWAEAGIRVNSISGGGVYTEQADDFVAKLSNLIPMGRMANVDEYQGAIMFLCSDASSYMTGANLVIDGGRTTW